MIQELLGPPVAEVTDNPARLTAAPGSIGCPLCRRPVPIPLACRDGSRPLAECVPCDLYFDPRDAEGGRGRPPA